MFFFFFYCSGDHRDLHLLTPPFPPRRSSDLGRLLCRRRSRLHYRAGSQRKRRVVDLESCALLPRRKCARSIGSPPTVTAFPASRLWKAPGATSPIRSEEHTYELQSLMRISYAVFCLKKQNTTTNYYKL